MVNNISGNTVSANELITSKIILGGWIIEGAGDGLYVTTPGGVKTKVELIDMRETPVPETAALNLPPAGESPPSTALPGGPDLPGPDSTIST